MGGHLRTVTWEEKEATNHQQKICNTFAKTHKRPMRGIAYLAVMGYKWEEKKVIFS